ncbi:MAG: hypothetical protein HY719_04325, partial [Planctomycetes bacterium]|nr:hypothetical protein [Planctomycetota bacterium]
DPGRAGVETALSAFLGEIEQVPPAHCAVKIDGERAYRLARRDQPVTLPPRRVLVEKITVTAYDFPRVRFDVVCSRGTYVRALARDLGERLGTGAFLSALRRTAIGSLRVEEALTPETASARNIQPVERLLAAFPRVPATAGEALALFHGKRIPLPAAARSLPAGVPLFAWKEQRVLCRLLVGERGAEARCDYWLAEDDVLSPAAGPGPA